jgi:hypothetical protein
MPHLDPAIALSEFVGSLPAFVTIILAWLHATARISDTNARFDKRLDDMREFIHAENEATRAGFRRVEEVMDARLKHLEDER